MVVVDRSFHVLLRNRQCENLRGLRADEVIGTHLLSIDSGLPVEQLKIPLRACLSGDEKLVELDLPATNRCGRAIHCKLICTPLVNTGDEIRGVMILMEENE